jgi:hypothetical protein
MNAEGEILREQTITHDGISITELLDELDKITHGRPQQVGVSIEVPRGPVVEAFLERTYAVPVTKAIQLLGIDPEYSVGLAPVHSFGHARVKCAASAPANS